MTQGPTGKATRLYPLPPRELPAGEIYADLELPPAEWSQGSRPYVIINMVSSIDGKTAIGGKSAGLGSRMDRQTMRNLRAKADAVMIGASTLRSEKLSLGLDDPEGPQPLAVVLTASGDLPLEENLVLPKRQKLVLIGPEPAVGRFGPETALVLPAGRSGSIDLRAALAALKAEYGVNLLLVEGGPGLNHALISSALVDQLFLTVAPILVVVPHDETLPADPSLEQSPARLLSIHLSEGGDELFLRYALQRHPV